MSHRYVMCTRAVKKGKFVSEPGATLHLLVPDGSKPAPQQAISADEWFKRLQKDAIWGRDSRDPDKPRGDILFFVHGYNNSQKIVMERHDQLSADLQGAGFKGVVVSFDWPSDDKALNYVEDRHDAKKTAMELVTAGIRILAEKQTPECAINIHMLGHSTGAYVIREAFDDADDAKLQNNAWIISQIAFIGGDVSAASMEKSNATTESLYRHCVRLTNYSNLKDSVLKLSNAKRIGVAPRVGRVGMPGEIPANAVNVDCTSYFELLESSAAVRARDQVAEIGTFDHSWHIGNRVFALDLFETLKGDVDRTIIPTRLDRGGQLVLIAEPAQ